MKIETFPGYTYEIDGKIVVNPRLMPVKSKLAIFYYQDAQAMIRWESQNIEVENVRYDYVSDTWQFYDKPHWSATKFWHKIVEGKENLDAQPCIFTKSGKKATITSLK
jgi:hypothetical protein